MNETVSKYNKKIIILESIFTILMITTLVRICVMLPTSQFPGLADDFVKLISFALPIVISLILHAFIWNWEQNICCEVLGTSFIPASKEYRRYVSFRIVNYLANDEIEKSVSRGWKRLVIKTSLLSFLFSSASILVPFIRIYFLIQRFKIMKLDIVEVQQYESTAKFYKRERDLKRLETSDDKYKDRKEASEKRRNYK